MEMFLSLFIAFAIYLIYVLSLANIVWFKQSLDEQTKSHEERMKVWNSIIDGYKKHC